MTHLPFVVFLTKITPYSIVINVVLQLVLCNVEDISARTLESRFIDFVDNAHFVLFLHLEEIL